jgi:hypothetical protein
MSADDFKPKKAPPGPAQAEVGAEDTDALYEQAQAWRDKMIATVQDPEATDWLRDLSREALIEDCVVSGKFYNPFVYRPALQWRDAQISRIQENPSPAEDESLQWLESLSGDDLIWAHKLYQGAKKNLALYRKAEEWRDDMLSANLPQNDWLKSLAGMDSEQLAKEYQFFVELWCTPETEGETPKTAGEQE